MAPYDTASFELFSLIFFALSREARGVFLFTLSYFILSVYATNG